MLRFRLSVIAISLLPSLLSFNVQAKEVKTTVIEKHVIVSPAPKAVCTPVAGHWESGVWINKHDICKYEGRTEGVAWVSDYWSCTEANADGTCITWVLVPGYWVKTIE